MFLNVDSCFFNFFYFVLLLYWRVSQVLKGRNVRVLISASVMAGLLHVPTWQVLVRYL